MNSLFGSIFFKGAYEKADMTVDYKNDKPLYLQVVDLIKKRIAENVWSLGMMIPSENELAREFNISAGTIKKSLSMLVQEGVLFRRQGKGTFVSSPDFSKSFNRFFRYDVDENGQQKIPETKVLEMSVEKADGDVAKILSSEKVIKLKRLRLLDGTPFVLEDIFLPYERFKGFENIDISNSLLYPIFHEQFETPVMYAKENIHPEVADPYVAKLLEIKENSPVMCIERIAYTYKDSPVEVRYSIGRGDTFKYSIVVR